MSVDLPLTCHLSPRLTSFAFRSIEVRRLLLDLDPCGGSDPFCTFPLFLKRTDDVLAPCVSAVFRRLVHLGSFPACWKQANVTPIRKGPPPFSVATYRPISITSVFSEVFERLVSVRLGRFMCFQPHSLLIRKVWVPMMHFCLCRIHCKVHLRKGSRLGSYKLISAQPLIGSTIREFCIISVMWRRRFCVVYFDTVSIKSIITHYC